MDRLFRESGLMRDKWDRSQSGTTYGRITLEKAAANCSSTYEPQFGIEDDFGELSEQLQKLHPNDNNRYNWADNGAGRLFADIYKSSARFVPKRKSWHVYDGTRWVADTASLRVMEMCKDLADALMVFVE